MSQKLEIRFAKEEHCEELAKIKVDIWKKNHKGIYSDEELENFDVESECDRLKNAVSNSKIKFYMVQVYDEIVGFIEYGKHRNEEREYVYAIKQLYIKEEHRNKGIGKKLFNLAKSTMMLKKVPEFYVVCNYYTENVKSFWEKMGFRKISVFEYFEDKPKSTIKYAYKLDYDN